jgi:outer membrane protein
MKWTAVPSALVACLLATVAGLNAQQVTRMTLDEAIELARQNNPTFQQTLTDLAPAQWNVRAANANLFLPDANLSFSTSWQDAGKEQYGGFTSAQPSILISNYSVGLSYQLNGSTLFSPGQRRAERTAVERRIDDAELQLTNSVTSFYIEVLRLQEQAVQADRELRRSEEHLRLAQARQEVGAGTRLETMQAEVARGQARVALLQAQNTARVAKLRLIQALGVDMPADQIELVSDFEIFEPTLDLESWVAEAMAAHPTLIAARADREAANSSVKVAKASYFPTLSLRAGWSGFTREETDPTSSIASSVASARSNAAGTVALCNTFAELYNASTGSIPPEFSSCSDFAFDEPQDSIDIANRIRRQNDVFPFNFENSPVSVSLSFSVPIFAGFDRQVQVESAIARRNDMDYQVRGLELQIRADVTEAVHNMETAYQTVLLQEENTAMAGEEMRLAQERYQLGAGTFLELLDSQTLAAQAEVDQIDAVFSFYQSLTQLEAAVGRPLDLRGGE